MVVLAMTTTMMMLRANEAAAVEDISAHGLAQEVGRPGNAARLLGPQWPLAGAAVDRLRGLRGRGRHARVHHPHPTLQGGGGGSGRGSHDGRRFRAEGEDLWFGALAQSLARLPLTRLCLLPGVLLSDGGGGESVM